MAERDSFTGLLENLWLCRVPAEAEGLELWEAELTEEVSVTLHQSHTTPWKPELESLLAGGIFSGKEAIIGH